MPADIDIKLRQATPQDALFIATGFHMAMLYNNTTQERLQNFAKAICSRYDVLYSWKNTTIAVLEGKPVGMLTSYDGKNYKQMRKTTMRLVKDHFGITFPDMEDEATEGEYYIDSLAIMSDYRKKGIGKRLLKHAIGLGLAKNLCVTLAVDPKNDRAQQLYKSIGFSLTGEVYIFGHNYLKMAISPQKSPNITNIRERVLTSTTISNFQRKVYLALLGVPRGETITYGELGKRIGCKSAQAIGQALRRNPFAPEVPCHRVIASDGSLGGFHGQREGEMIERKRKLLREEGVEL